MAKKAKFAQQSEGRLGRKSFIILWSLSLIAAVPPGMLIFILGISVSTRLEVLGILPLQWFNVIFGLPSVLTVLGIQFALQKFFLRGRIGWRMNGWIRWGLVGTVFGIIIDMLIAWVSFTLNRDNGSFFFYRPLLTPLIPFLVHTWILRRYVGKAWLYALSSTVGTILFIVGVSLQNTLLAVLMLIASGVVNAVIIDYLIQESYGFAQKKLHQSQSVKHALAESGSDDEDLTLMQHEQHLASQKQASE